ncbi:hypothetical protein A6770_16925 [Nostoc minutum NIES-26]|uniref:Nif11 domain-containing protein n=1 Tax=Nostoc minutum NIES-26 TaxID=1844469 RepID=A0A367RE87_9NOSO|nr:hypothetical protein A6770_16925 [Nostoc minutum NIES-26]
MSLQQVNAFYEVLISDQAIYEQYLKKCCRRGFFGSCHWDKTKIVNFATTIGYKFTEDELAQVLFEDEASFCDSSLNLSAHGQLS